MKKRKRLLVIIIIPLALILVAGGWYLMFSLIDGAKYRTDELKSCSYTSGGGMMGGYSSTTLKKDKEGQVFLEVKSKEMHSSREITTIYPAGPEALDHIHEIAVEYNLYRASKRPRSKVIVMDGETSTLSFSYSEGSFRISSDLVLTSKMAEGVDQVTQYLYSLAAGEGITSVEPQTATLYLKSGYTLRFIVEDAFDGKLNGILDTDHETARFEQSGIVLAQDVDVDTSAGERKDQAAAGDIIFDPETRQIIVLYEDYSFESPVFVLAVLDDYISSAAPLIEEMEGIYKLYLN